MRLKRGDLTAVAQNLYLMMYWRYHYHQCIFLIKYSPARYKAFT